MLHLEGGYHCHFYMTERLSQLTIDISWLYDFQHAKSDPAFRFLFCYDSNKNDKSFGRSVIWIALAKQLEWR